MDLKQAQEIQRYQRLVDLLSFEKIAFNGELYILSNAIYTGNYILQSNSSGTQFLPHFPYSDLQLRPYRTDDFITKLYYETSRFSAFNYQWVIKAHVNDSQKSPEKTCRRALGYQLILKSKIEHPFHVHFLALRGPYGEMQAKPAVYEFEFTKENAESPIRDLPIESSNECNKLFALKNINMRLIMFQVPKKQ